MRLSTGGIKGCMAGSEDFEGGIATVRFFFLKDFGLSIVGVVGTGGIP